MVSSDIVKSNYYSRRCQIVYAPPRGAAAARTAAAVVAAALALAFPPAPASAQDAAKASAFARGAELFARDKPLEAVPLLEAAAAEDPANADAWLYLGIAYQQAGKSASAAAALEKGLARAGERKALFAYNLGNARFSEGDMAAAVAAYGAALEADPSYASAHLNRANARVKTGKAAEAVADYRAFLSLAPDSPKRPAIEKLIALVEAEAAEKERLRLAEEAREKAQAEELERQRIAREEAERLEAERRQRLLDEVAASLQAAAEETRGLKAGSEDVIQYEGDFELE